MGKTKRVSYGLMFLSLSSLMWELILTRIFSVIIWHHYAFMVISLAMFGFGISGVYVYIRSKSFKKVDFYRQLKIYSSLYPITIATVFIILVKVPMTISASPKGILTLGFIYLLSSTPFFFAGMCISLIFTHMSDKISSLYFYDLIGAGFGCFIVILALNYLGAPASMFVICTLATIGATFFSRLGTKKSGAYALNIAMCFVFAMLAIVGMTSKFFNITFTKGHYEKNIVYTRWNTFSRIAAFPIFKASPDKKKSKGFFAWGLSKNFKGPFPDQMDITIDATADTPVTRFKGNLDEVVFAKMDISSLAYHLKEKPDVAIIGPGGGKDVLAALGVNSNSITAIEINPNIIHAVDDILGSFSGHIYSNPKVDIVIDDGRNAIRKSKKKFDIIQASLIDTWAATAAGAYTLSENSLYTVEAFVDYLEHLKSGGLVTISRWLFTPPRQSIRLASIGMAALRKIGVKEPQKHIAVVSMKLTEERGISTFILKKTPFTPKELLKLSKTTKSMGFDITYTPDTRRNNNFNDLLFSENPDEYIDNYEFNIRPTTDDKPFFFQMTKPANFFDFGKVLSRRKSNKYSGDLGADFILASLFIIVSFIVMLFIVIPLFFFKREALREDKGKKIFYLLYFSCLGLGFMQIEMAMIQKFILFLGHPTYAISVILFTVLIFSGIGSFASGKFAEKNCRKVLQTALILLVLLVVGYINFLGPVFHSLMQYNIGIRIISSILLLAPLGFLMGIPFPSGIRLLDRLSHEMVPWVWGINGASSVLGSVIALIFAVNFGYNFTLAAGMAIYTVAFGVITFCREG